MTRNWSLDDGPNRLKERRLRQPIRTSSDCGTATSSAEGKFRCTDSANNNPIDHKVKSTIFFSNSFAFFRRFSTSLALNLECQPIRLSHCLIVSSFLSLSSPLSLLSTHDVGIRLTAIDLKKNNTKQNYRSVGVCVRVRVRVRPC